MLKDRRRSAWAENNRAMFICTESVDNFEYGVYKWTVQLVANSSRLEKILFPIFWGLMTLSTFGMVDLKTSDGFEDEGIGMVDKKENIASKSQAVLWSFVRTVLGNKLVALVLKGNLFRSGIPPELRNFDQLQLLDFSNNNILGIIPSTLFFLSSLQYINLAGNGLMGASKNTSCSSKLRFVDISENHLVGDLPSCIRHNSSVRTVLYAGNCLSTGDLKYQHPDSFCHEKAFAVKPPTEISKKHSNSKLDLVLGIIGAMMGGVILLGLIVLVVGKWVTEKKTRKDPVANKSFNGLSPKLVTNARHGSTTMMFGALGLPQYHVFRLEEIEEATNNFDASNLIGEGSQGQLYKVWLRDGSAAVVRCLKLKQKQSSSSLGRHIEVLSKLRHEHLVSVLGHNTTKKVKKVDMEYSRWLGKVSDVKSLIPVVSKPSLSLGNLRRKDGGTVFGDCLSKKQFTWMIKDSISTAPLIFPASIKVDLIVVLLLSY